MISLLAQASSLEERIDELLAKSKEKEATLKLKERELGELEEIKRALETEIEQIREDRNSKISDVILNLAEISTKEYSSLPANVDRMNDGERYLLEILSYIIFKREIP
jgi:chromosome segregation ATPase